MEDQYDSTASAARTAFDRVFVPAIRVLAWGAVCSVCLAIFILLVGDGSTRAARFAIVLFQYGLLPISFLFGLIGLLILPMKEKVALFGLMLLTAWLTV
jgi:hypothetical protein